MFQSARELIAEFADGEPAEEESRGRVVCLPASDRADWITASMLAQLLQQHGFEAAVLPERSMLRKGSHPDDVICISALPPFASVRAQALVTRIRARSPHSKIIVGLWGHSGDVEQALSRFGRNQPDRLCTTLEDAVQQTVEWRQPVAPSA